MLIDTTQTKIECDLRKQENELDSLSMQASISFTSILSNDYWNLRVCCRYEKWYQIEKCPNTPWGNGMEYYTVECKICGRTVFWGLPDNWRERRVNRPVGSKNDN